jgi:hypothetical protein
METQGFSETSINFYQSAWYHRPEDSDKQLIIFPIDDAGSAHNTLPRHRPNNTGYK